MARPDPRPVVVQRPVDRVVVRFLVAAVIASGAMANLAAASGAEGKCPSWEPSQQQ